MKKKALIISAISVTLAVLIAVSGIWFLFLRDGSGERIDVLRLTTVEEVLLQEDFSSTVGGAIPEGWVKTVPYKFISGADKSTSLETTGGNKNHVSVRKSEDGKSVLAFYGREGGNILTLPEAYEGDIMISFDLSFKSFKTPFGIALGLADDPEEATKATIFQLYGKEKKLGGDEVGLIPTFSLYDRVSKGGDFVGADKKRKDFTAFDYIPEQIMITDKKSNTGTIPSDRVLNIKVYRYDGVFYFYCDGVLITSTEDRGEGNRIGFFSDLSGREAEVSNLSICSLCYAPEISQKIYNIGTLYECDFSDEGLDVGDWALLSDFLNDGAEGKYDRNEKGTFLSAEDTAVLRSPAVNSKNLKISASLIPKSETGRFGVISNINASINRAGAGVFAGIDLENKQVVGCDLPDMRLGINYDAKAVSDLTLKTGKRYDITVYILDGRQYLFINDEFILNSELPTTFQKQYCGFCVTGGEAELLSFKADAIVRKGTAEGLLTEKPELIIGTDSVGLNLSGRLLSSDPLYAYVKDMQDIGFGFVCAPKGEEPVTLDTKGVINVAATAAPAERGAIGLSGELKTIPKEDLCKIYEVRGYLALQNEEEKTVFYGPSVFVNPAATASGVYTELTEQKDKDLLDRLFEGCESYIGKYEKTLTFSLFSDFHYKYGMYSTSVADMDTIFDRANKAGAQFILSGGDFCNDFAGSPELMNAFLKNKYNMPAYNVYGNHELEAGNTMQFVTPLLTNDNEVVWGTADGKIGDGSIAYYYFDRGGFRVICTDTNYSFNPTKGEWEHNYTGSYGPPEGNTKGNALGPVQLSWLEKVLTDAADNGIPCIVIGHAAYTSQIGGASADAEAVRAIYGRVNNIRKGTVLMSINGHYHTNRIFESDGVLYFDMNTTRNGEWRGTGEEHYGKSHTFEQVEYDSMGEPVTTRRVSLGELTMGKNTWFFEDPLSAIVTVSQYGTITVEGMESRWIYGVNPENTGKYTEPKVSSGTWELIKK